MKGLWPSTGSWSIVFRNADMQGCVCKALNIVSNSGSQSNENKSSARLRPNKNRLTTYFRFRTLKNVGSVLSESSLRLKVGHGKIKTGPQITLEKNWCQNSSAMLCCKTPGLAGWVWAKDFHTSLLSESAYHSKHGVEINSFQFRFIVLGGKILKAKS